MAASDSTKTWQHPCPDCGAQPRPGDGQCWLCGAALPIAAEAASPVAAEIVSEQAAPPVVFEWQRRRMAQAMPFQFSIETLLLVTTLVAVCLGASVAVPGLGIPVSILALPALVRTLVASHQQRAVGHKLTLGEKALTFLVSTGLMVAVFAAGGAAFFATCTVLLMGAVAVSQASPNAFSGGSEWPLYVLIVLSSLAGLGMGAWIFWITRPRQPRW
ncbi:MAG: hypothetical protein SFU86_05550 [Pirellulaceae bacterium]|nr:hypothetical protein [Pirellulaceae bacterium]